MKKPDWMERAEEPLGSWAVFIGENGPTSEKITGRLHITTWHVYFIAGLHLDRRAGLMMAGGRFGYHADVRPPFQISDKRIKIARNQIRRITTSRQWLILASLHLHLVSGEELVFRFGATPLRGAVAALTPGSGG